MRILSPPVLVGERLCRVVSPIASLLEVEEWVGAWGEPSAVTITTASQARQAPATILHERGVPAEDHATGAPVLLGDVQTLMRASVVAYVQPLAVDPESARRSHGSRRKVYAGNSRFRRGRAAGAADSTQAELRDRTSTTEWSGPWRRATDDPSPPGPAAS